MKNWKVELGVLVLLILLAAAALFYWPGWAKKYFHHKKSAKVSAVKEPMVSTDSLQFEITALAGQVDQLKEANDSLAEENCKLLKRDSSLSETNKTLAKTNARLARSNAELVAKIRCNDQSAIVVSQPPAKIETKSPVKSNLQEDKQVTPKISTKNLNMDKYYDHDGKIYFCVDLGGNPGRYVPHLALMKGYKFPTVAKNDEGGWNWFVIKPSPTMTGDYGVTTSGVFYVSKALIDKLLKKSDKGLVEIKTTVTGWANKKMSISNDGKYYVYKP